MCNLTEKGSPGSGEPSHRTFYIRMAWFCVSDSGAFLLGAAPAQRLRVRLSGWGSLSQPSPVLAGFPGAMLLNPRQFCLVWGTQPRSGQRPRMLLTVLYGSVR